VSDPGLACSSGFSTEHIPGRHTGPYTPHNVSVDSGLNIQTRSSAVFRAERPDWEVIRAIVLHDTDGSTVTGALAHFAEMAKQNKGRGYHYLIGRKGEILQLVPESDRTAHAAGANRGTIGISLVGGGVRAGLPNKLQLASAEKLIANIKERHPIEYILGHRHVRLSPFTPSGKSDPRISDAKIEEISKKFELTFDRSGKEVSTLNEELGKREMAEALGCLVFPESSWTKRECRIAVKLLIESPKNEQQRLFKLLAE